MGLDVVVHTPQDIFVFNGLAIPVDLVVRLVSVQNLGFIRPHCKVTAG